MWENFIGQQIRRCNRNLLIANVIFLFAGITCGAACALVVGADEGWWTLGIGSPFLLLAGWNLSKWRKRALDYTCHPICKRLACFGAVEQVIQQIEAAILMNPVEKIAGVRLFGPWLFKPSILGLTCFHVPDLVWVYRKVTTHSVNFIPVGQSSEALLYDRYGFSAKMQASKRKVELLMTHLCQQSPWIVAGFSEDLEKLWKSRKGEFVAAVDERRKEFAKTSAVGAGK
jgi:hypothetical protein